MNFIPEQSKNAADVPYEEQPKKLNYTPPPNCRRLGKKEFMREGDIAIDPTGKYKMIIRDAANLPAGYLLFYKHVYRPLPDPEKQVNEQPEKLNYTPPPNCRRLGNKEIMQEGDIAINPDDGRIINIGDKWIAAIGLLVEKNIIFTHVYRPLLSPSIYEKALTIATNKLKNLADDCRYFSVQCEAQHTLDIIDKMLRESQ